MEGLIFKNKLTIHGVYGAAEHLDIDNPSLSTYLPMPTTLNNTVWPEIDVKLMNGYVLKHGLSNEKPIQCTNGTEKRREHLRKKYGASNWYDWRMKNWGVKWDCEMGNPVRESNRIIFEFESPLNYPSKWVEVMSERYPGHTFDLSYICEGMWVCGRLIMCGGKVLECWYGEPVYVDEYGEEYAYDHEGDLRSCVDLRGAEKTKSMTIKNQFEEL